MKKVLFNFILIAVICFGAASAREGIVSVSASADSPTRPAVSVSGTVLQTASVSGTLLLGKSVPDTVIIPSINLDSPIQPLGLNSKGEMDVPNGKTNNVGWYQYGTVPGDIGSAVLDAHVFAAFANLNQLTSGSDIYIVSNDGAKLHFVVSDVETYALADVPLKTLFNRRDGRYLNLITCAGKLTPDHSTYDHRLIVYTKEIEE